MRFSSDVSFRPAMIVRRCAFPATVAMIVALPSAALAQRPAPDPQDFHERASKASRAAEERGLAEPFVGVTTDGTPIEGIFPIRSTGVSTEPIAAAAAAFRASLSDEQRTKITFPVEDDEWRKWMNQHFYRPQGVSFDEMSEAQRDAAFGMLGASLSAEGLELSRNVMRLNHTLGELTNNLVEYGEWFYWISMFGEPQTEEPWGWQLDGHHLIINYFVLGDQVVMTPFFVGSEPVIATSGKFKGTEILQTERIKALEVMQALDEAQRSRAVIETKKGRSHNVSEAFKDNVVLDYAGVPVRDLDSDQRRAVLELAGLFVANLRPGHAEVRLEEIEAHLDDTWFAWIGGYDSEDAVFYFRIQSPVVLIEFDHQGPIGLRHLYEPGPMKDHIHAVVRTPNGNDYGRDLLRQHHEAHPHGAAAREQP